MKFFLKGDDKTEMKGGKIGGTNGAPPRRSR